MTDKIDRTPAMGLWRYADDFMRAANTIYENNTYRVSDTILYYLYCHAIELGLKAFLRSHESTAESIKQLGHDLDRIFTNAKSKDTKNIISLSAEDEAAIRTINPYYVNKEFEYILVGYKTFPEMRYIKACAEKVVKATKLISSKHTSTKIKTP